MMKYDPCDRIRTINSFLFRQIYLDYINNVTSRDFAVSKLNKYREVSYQLAEQLTKKNKFKAIESTEESYSKYIRMF